MSKLFNGLNTIRANLTKLFISCNDIIVIVVEFTIESVTASKYVTYRNLADSVIIQTIWTDTMDLDIGRYTSILYIKEI